MYEIEKGRERTNRANSSVGGPIEMLTLVQSLPSLWPRGRSYRWRGYSHSSKDLPNYPSKRPAETCCRPRRYLLGYLSLGSRLQRNFADGTFQPRSWGAGRTCCWIDWVSRGTPRAVSRPEAKITYCVVHAALEESSSSPGLEAGRWSEQGVTVIIRKWEVVHVLT